MTTFKTTLIFSFLLCQAIGFAQASNAQKIIGCWKIESASVSKSFKGSDQMISGVKHMVICFENDGKFSNRKDGKILSQGTYSVTPDGKTINQSSGENQSEMDIPGNIIALTDTDMEIQAEEITLHFKKE